MGNDRLTLVVVPIIVAIIGVVSALGAAALSNWDKFFPHAPVPEASTESKTAATPATIPSASPSHPLAAVARPKASLFIIPSSDLDGASVGTQLLSVLRTEGFRIANDRNSAKLLIEIQAPDLGPPQAYSIGGVDNYSIVTTLTARVVPRSNATGDTAPIQRQALGVGRSEAEARLNSIAAATDRLGKSIADTLH